MQTPIILLLAMPLFAFNTGLGFAMHNGSIYPGLQIDNSLMFTVRIEHTSNNQRVYIAHDSAPTYNDPGYGYNRIGYEHKL